MLTQEFRLTVKCQVDPTWLGCKMMWRPRRSGCEKCFWLNNGLNCLYRSHCLCEKEQRVKGVGSVICENPSILKSDI